MTDRLPPRPMPERGQKLDPGGATMPAPTASTPPPPPPPPGGVPRQAIPPSGHGRHVSTRRFELHRDHDVSGVSGTGVVADGVEWPDGSVSIRWRGERPSIVFWHSLADAEQVHGHGGATRFVWLDSDTDWMRWTGLNTEAVAEFCNEHGLGYRIVGPLLCISFAGSELQALPGGVVAYDGKSLTIDHRADMKPAATR